MSAHFMVLVSNVWSRNRSLSVRSKKGDGEKHSAKHHRFTMASLRGIQQPDLSKKLYRLIKTENHAISAYETAAKEQTAIATQLSEWGEETGDDTISDISDKLGVLLSEIAEQEDVLAQGLEESRAVLKQIRNTESSVQPSRDHKNKISDEIQKLKYKEPSSTKIVTLEQELVRAEAQSLVAEAQLTNITRQKFKEAFDLHTAAIIERAEKQILLANNARKLISLIDDTPIVPGDSHPAFAHTETGRDILNVAEHELRQWSSRVEPIPTNSAGLGSNAMPIANAMPAATGGRLSSSSYADERAEYPEEYPTAQPPMSHQQQPMAHQQEPMTHQHEPTTYQHEQTGIPSTTAEPPYPVYEESKTTA